MQLKNPQARIIRPAHLENVETTSIPLNVAPYGITRPDGSTINWTMKAKANTAILAMAVFSSPNVFIEANNMSAIAPAPTTSNGSIKVKSSIIFSLASILLLSLFQNRNANIRQLLLNGTD